MDLWLLSYNSQTWGLIRREGYGPTTVTVAIRKFIDIPTRVVAMANVISIGVLLGNF